MTRTLTHTDEATGQCYELDLSVESGSLGLPAPMPDRTHTSIGIEAARDEQGRDIDPEDLPQSVHEWVWALSPGDL